MLLSPLLSIIIPSYNRESIIVETLDSVLAQTYINWECIVVDDGSTDNTWQVLEGYKQRDDRIKILKRNREPKNANTCRNIGVENSSGHYIIFLDSDDLLASNCLSALINKFNEYPQCDYLITPVLIFNHATYKGDTVLLKNLILYHTPLQYFISHEILWCISSPIYKSSFLKSNNLNFDENLLRFQDIDFHIQVLNTSKKFKVLHKQKSTIFYRKYLGTIQDTESEYKKELALKSAVYFYKKYSDIVADKYLTQKLFFTCFSYALHALNSNDAKFLINEGKTNHWLNFKMKIYIIFVSCYQMFRLQEVIGLAYHRIFRLLWSEVQKALPQRSDFNKVDEIVIPRSEA
jgi:glycosyltransferase involved in cell wall biosynthesis